MFSGTIRDNILFSTPYDPNWHATVLAVCALNELFPNKDETIVGERGVVLSGRDRELRLVWLVLCVRLPMFTFWMIHAALWIKQLVSRSLRNAFAAFLLTRFEFWSLIIPGMGNKPQQVVVLENGRVMEKLTPQLRHANNAEDMLQNISTEEYETDGDLHSDQSSQDKPRGLKIPHEDRVTERHGVLFPVYWLYFISKWNTTSPPFGLDYFLSPHST